MNQSLIRYLREHPFILLPGIAVLTVATILLTLIPSEYLVKSKIWDFDKLGHILLFGFWTFLFGLHQMIHFPQKTKPWIIFAMGLTFGGIIELLQFILPIHRHADFLDLGFDALGAFFAALALRYLFKSP